MAEFINRHREKELNTRLADRVKKHASRIATQASLYLESALPQRTDLEAIASQSTPSSKRENLLALPAEVPPPVPESAEGQLLHKYSYGFEADNHPLQEIGQALFKNEGELTPGVAVDLAQLTDVPVIRGMIERTEDGGIISPPIIESTRDDKSKRDEVQIGSNRVISVKGNSDPFKALRLVRLDQQEVR